MQRMLSKRISLLLATAATAALMLGGCSGDNGANGTNGTNGTISTGPVNITALSAEDQAKLTFKGEVTSVTINSPPVVKFKVTDGNGNPVIGLGVRDTNPLPRLNNLKFALAKLVPGANGSPSKWVSYIVTDVTKTPVAGGRPTQDREGALVDNGDGTYQYTFYRDITKVKDDVAALTDSGNNRKADLGDLTYDPTLTHRLIIEYGGNVINTSPSIAIANPLNVVYDFIPATGKVVTATDTQREVTTKAACNECHGAIGTTTPHGGRADTRYCVVCHTSQRAFGRAIMTSVAGVIPASNYVVDGEVLGEFVTMVHKIHMGNKLTKTGYSYVAFNAMGYPQDQGNCRKCHKAEASAQGDNWNLKPSRQACGSCHDGVNFATGAGHSLGNIVQTSDANCTTCHNAPAIKGFHMQLNKTPNNPETPAGMVNFTYEISSATVATNNDLAIKFRILGDGTPVTLSAPAATVAVPPAVTPPAGLAVTLPGFTSSPAFLLAYSQSGAKQTMTSFADFNNLGKAAAQPASIAIANLLNTNNALTTGNITGPDASGFYTATILSASAFPAGSKMRTVALQGTFTQVSPAGARSALSVVKTVTGDTARRLVVDAEKCGSCHEWFIGHGGSRIAGKGTGSGNAVICVMCHVPNLSTSGRGIPDATLVAYAFTATETAILTSWAFDKALVNAALAFPEASNNFKDMIHAIHAGKDSTVPMRFVRDRTTVILPFDTKAFAFPNILKNCEACHITPPAGTNKQTYKADLPAGVLPSTAVTTNGAIVTPTDVKTSRGAASLPNATDIVTAPIAAACVSCHTSAVAVAHMNSNGGNIATARTLASGLNIQGNAVRSAVVLEQCALCHGEGKVADVVKVHAK